MAKITHINGREISPEEQAEMPQMQMNQWGIHGQGTPVAEERKIQKPFTHKEEQERQDYAIDEIDQQAQQLAELMEQEKQTVQKQEEEQPPESQDKQESQREVASEEPKEEQELPGTGSSHEEEGEEQDEFSLPPTKEEEETTAIEGHETLKQEFNKQHAAIEKHKENEQIWKQQLDQWEKDAHRNELIRAAYENRMAKFYNQKDVGFSFDLGEAGKMKYSLRSPHLAAESAKDINGFLSKFVGADGSVIPSKVPELAKALYMLENHEDVLKAAAAQGRAAGIKAARAKAKGIAMDARKDFAGADGDLIETRGGSRVRAVPESDGTRFGFKPRRR